MRRRSSRLAATFGTLALVVSMFSSATAAPPFDAPESVVAIEAADGFRVVSELSRPDGTVISTFASAKEIVRTISWNEGSSISFESGPATAATNTSPEHGSIMVGAGTERPKNAADIDRYLNSGRTVVNDLVALGMPRQEAERQFGDMETSDGSNP